MLWKRYIFFKTLSCFLFFILCFDLIYFTIDYSIHAGHFFKESALTSQDIALYYFYQLIKRLDIVLPLSLMLAIIKVFSSLNQKYELISLRMSGLSSKTLASPLFILGIISSILVLLNFEYLTPQALSYLDKFERANFRKTSLLEHKKDSIYAFRGPQDETILYKRYDSSQHQLIDVFILSSFDHIWKMKRLELSPTASIGHFVDVFIRDQEGNLQKENSFETYAFDSLDKVSYNRKTLDFSAENKSLSDLVGQLKLPTSKVQLSSKAHLAYKLSISLLSMLIILAITPKIMVFSRNFPIFMTYTFSLFGFIVCITIMDALVILAENGVASPELLFSTFFLLLLTGSSIQFFKSS